jgi:hypothetical protein
LAEEVAGVEYLFGDKYLFHILPNQQHARSDFCFDFVRGQLGSCGKVHHAEVKEIFCLAHRTEADELCPHVVPKTIFGR